MTATTTTKKPTPLPLRNDTILGVCEAIGQDFGFNAMWLRLAFIAPLFWQPVPTIAVYFLLGAIVAVSRFVAPRHSATVTTLDTSANAARADADDKLSIAA